jgi:2-C-methyl-D-erythritol 4-phosphate cytidylyltransferase / 2-C-methyl-D-erythritol 2,4-cyclodiphosphate synthase
VDCLTPGKHLPEGAAMSAIPPLPAGAAAVIVAAGEGLRAGQPLPKQFALWRGKPVLRHSVELLAEAGVSPIAVVIQQLWPELRAFA